MNKLKILEQWQAASEALDKASEHLLKFGMSIESETVSAVHDAMDEVTKLASVAVGDAFEVLSWYQYDNEMGTLGLQVFVDGEASEAREIRTLEDLLWSMDCGCDETPLIVTEPDGSQWVALEDYLKVAGAQKTHA